MSMGGVATSPSPEPLELADELLIKHRQLGIEDDGLGAQSRDGLRQLRETLRELFPWRLTSLTERSAF
jgi:hypothetical protein